MLITRGVAKKLHGESQLHEIHATDFSYCKATHVGCKSTYCAADYQREKSVTSAERKRIMLYCGYLESLSLFSKIAIICVFIFVHLCSCIYKNTKMHDMVVIFLVGHLGIDRKWREWMTSTKTNSHIISCTLKIQKSSK